MFKVKKSNGKLEFKDHGGYQTRNPATMWCIKQADGVYNWPDFKEITVYTHDYQVDNHVYSYSKDIYSKLVPDFNFHGWPEAGMSDYDEVVSEISNAGRYPPKVNKVGWIGNSDTNVRRHTMMSIGKEHSDIFHFIDMKWTNVQIQGSKQLRSTMYMSLPDLVKEYSVLIDIEGMGYSGRLKYLLWSRRPVLLVDRPHKEYFFKHLKEYVHYIPVKRDLSDLVEKTQWVLDNYTQALEIAENAYNFSTIHLTRSACYEQWNRIIMDI